MSDDEARDLGERVAQAADAWLGDPADVAAYARLVAAVRARRAHLATAALHRRPAPASAAGAAAEHGPGDDVPAVEEDEAADVVAEVRPVGAGLDGDPRAVLHRLRTGLR